ncbi:MAG TPA: alkaline phosphatase family protein [Acidimicrobiales bacterium]|nr:alkaline phosphatase family protein [Acidimicrobiales bacterium]
MAKRSGLMTAQALKKVCLAALMVAALPVVGYAAGAQTEGPDHAAAEIARSQSPHGLALQEHFGMLHPCGHFAVPRVDKVLLVWEENHSYSSVIGNPQAPTINAIAARCGLATNYQAVDHPSLPNYMQMTSGEPFYSYPWNLDCDPGGACLTNAPSIFSELIQAHKQWRSYAEGMSQNCGRVSYGTYAAKHNPAVYYRSVAVQCEAWDLSMGTPQSGPLRSMLLHGPAVPLVTMTPDVNDDMHNGTIQQADAWLARWLPRVVASPAYQLGHLAVIIAWDEGPGVGDYGSTAPLLVMSASTRTGTKSSLSLNDYSVLAAMSHLTGVKPLGLAATAPSMVKAFNL